MWCVAIIKRYKPESVLAWYPVKTCLAFTCMSISWFRSNDIFLEVKTAVQFESQA